MEASQIQKVKQDYQSDRYKANIHPLKTFFSIIFRQFFIIFHLF